jgi:WD40 repeat protein
MTSISRIHRHAALARAGGTIAILCLLLAPAAASFAQSTPDLLWTGGGDIGVISIALTPNGSVLATGSSGDHTVKLWNPGDGRLLRTLAAHYGQIQAVAVSADGAFLASAGEAIFGGDDDAVKLWRISDGALVRTFATDFQEGWSVAFSPDGTLLAAGVGTDVRIWRLSDGALVHTLSGHGWFVFGVAFSPNGATLASASGDRTVKLWRVSDGAPLRTLTGHTGFVSSVAFSPDGTALVSGSWDMTVRLWRVSDGAPLGTATGHTGSVYSVAFAPGGTRFASGSEDNTVKIWSFPGASLIRTLSDPDVRTISSVAFMDGGLSVAAGAFDGKTRVWNLGDGSLTRTIGHHAGSVREVAFSPDGGTLGSASQDFTARLWRTSDGAELHTLIGHDDVVNTIAISAGGVVATGAGSPPPDTRDPTIKLWRASDGALLRTLPGHEGGTTSVAFPPDGDVLASGGRDDRVRFWRTSDGAALGAITVDGGGVRMLAYSSDGTLLATANGNSSIKLWDPETNGLIRTISLGASPSSIAFSQDGTMLAVGLDAYGNNVELRRVSDGSLVRAFAGDPNGFIHGVDLTPDGSILASASGYTFEIRFWRVSDGTLLADYTRETGWGPWPALPIAFSPDGSTFGYGRADACVGLARNSFGSSGVGPAERGNGGPAMLAASPNPFVRSTGISFRLETPGLVQARILDVQGRAIRELEGGRLAAGQHRLIWDGQDRAGRSAATGLYFVKVVSGGRTIGEEKLVRIGEN